MKRRVQKRGGSGGRSLVPATVKLRRERGVLACAATT
jgi:hypothetical protein